MIDKQFQKLFERYKKGQISLYDMFRHTGHSAEYLKQLLATNTISKHEVLSYINSNFKMFEHPYIFKSLFENNALTAEDLKFFWDVAENTYKLEAFLYDDLFLLKKLVDNNAVSFKEVVDRYKTSKDSRNKSCFSNLLKNLQESFINEVLTSDDFVYLWKAIDDLSDLSALSTNEVLLKFFIDSNIVSFQELIDRYKEMQNDNNESYLCVLLWNTKLFEYSIQANAMTQEDLKYLLNKIDKSYELDQICNHKLMIEKILADFLLDEKTLKRLDLVVKNSGWCRERKVESVFNLIEYRLADDKVFELIAMNRYLSNNFNVEQKLELIDILKNNERAKAKLIQIANAHLTFSFNDLKLQLIKQEKKNLLNI